ncbi:unnamed protein product [Heterobilharzia americana]|nr:unnamed protein product [Heterobilharzia americana]CAH8580637.1 unnamed protein product [Heterobilharzia americana]
MLDFLQCQGECFISFATSFDENNPPESVLEKRDSSFWITTGMFPQMLVVSLVQPTKISKIKIISSNINLLLADFIVRSSQFRNGSELSKEQVKF